MSNTTAQGDHRLRLLRREALADPEKSWEYIQALERALGIGDEEPAVSFSAPGPVTEDNKDVIEGWYDQAKNVGSVDEFIDYLAEFRHDYGTICHAVAAAGIRAMHTMDRSPAGGITGFQAGAITWELVRHWGGREGPLSMVDFEKMLYPQYADQGSFRMRMSRDTFTWLQEKAEKQLRDNRGSPEVMAHCKSIVAGTVPFGWTVGD